MSKQLKKCSLLLIIGLISNGCIYCYPALVKAADVNSSIKESSGSASLQRLDFRIEGKSCAACLLSIQRKLNSLPGVKQAVVMLKHPYGVSVIYQTNEIKEDEILSIVKDKEPNIKVLEINDSKITKVPSPVIPPFVPLQESN